MGGGSRVAITGTPGAGKTSVSRMLEEKGFTLLSVEDLAEEFGCIGEVDPEDDARPIDTEKLGLSLNVEWVKPDEGVVIVDCLLYTSPSPRDRTRSRMPSSA